MNPFLLDANLSAKTAAYLEATFGLDVTDLFTIGRSTLSDEEVVALAIRERRVIITLDLDFGELYYRGDRGRFGVILLRLGNQTVESVNRVLDRFFRADATTISLDDALIVLDEERTRVFRRE